MKYRKRTLNLLMTIMVGATMPPVLAIAGAQTNPPSAQGSQPARKEISRERAIEIARERVDFKPKSVKAVRVIEAHVAVLGAGIEQAFAGGLSAKIEYNYIMTPDIRTSTISGSSEKDLDSHVIKAGINMRF